MISILMIFILLILGHVMLEEFSDSLKTLNWENVYAKPIEFRSKIQKQIELDLEISKQAEILQQDKLNDDEKEIEDENGDNNEDNDSNSSQEEEEDKNSNIIGDDTNEGSDEHHEELDNGAEDENRSGQNGADYDLENNILGELADFLDESVDFCTDNNGTDNTGTGNTGTDNNGTDSTGTDNTCTDNLGTDNMDNTSNGEVVVGKFLLHEIRNEIGESERFEIVFISPKRLIMDLETPENSVMHSENSPVQYLEPTNTEVVESQNVNDILNCKESS